jgi:hypothetical protein
MDPITLATATSAVTLLGTECAKGLASEAGKNLWSRMKALFGWTNEPDARELAKAIAMKLHSDQALLDQVITLFQGAKGDSSIQMIGSLVGSLTAEKVVVAQEINNIVM